MTASLIDASQFSPLAYAELINEFKAANYSFVGFESVDPAARHVILRHDIDFSLQAACAMAEQEKALGVTSTYFVLLRTEFYNAFSASGLEALREILSLGHKIGLHFDAALYPQDSDALNDAADQECQLLEGLLQQPVKELSFHRPAQGLIAQSASIAGRINAYAPRFVEEIGYCSDSRGAWHYGHPMQHDAVLEGRAIQLLVHPIWWEAPSSVPHDRIVKFLEARQSLLESEAALNCTAYKATDKR